MAGTPGPTTTDLIERFRAEPHTVDFFRALRWLQASAAEHPRLGTSLSPTEDPVRFGQVPFLRFAPSTLQPPPAKERGPANRIYSHQFGLFGPNGPLPLHLTEYARGRMLHHADLTIAAFCDIFHHRLTSFFFRAWAEPRKEVDLDRPQETNTRERRWPVFVGSLFGMGDDDLRGRDSIPDSAKLFYSGRLSHQPRNAEGLEAILGDFFRVPAKVETFVGRWLPVPHECRLRLGESPATGALGRGTLVGGRTWDCQLGFRVRFGPLGLADYERLLPGTASFRRLRDWVRHYTHEQYLWDVQLVLRREEVPDLKLGGSSRLGWNTWLRTRPLSRDPEDLLLDGSGRRD